jgi:hypothetical protein
VEHEDRVLKHKQVMKCGQQPQCETTASTGQSPSNHVTNYATSNVRVASPSVPALAMNQLKMPTTTAKPAAKHGAGPVPSKVPSPRGEQTNRTQPGEINLLPDSSKCVPLQWGVLINKPPAIPTSDTCPPPAPKLTLSREIRGKIERANQAPDAPSFDLGFESPKRFQDQGTSNNSNLPSQGITPVHLDGERFNIAEDDWDEATWREAVEAVEKAEREKGYRNGEPNSGTKSAQPQSCF